MQECRLMIEVASADGTERISVSPIHVPAPIESRRARGRNTRSSGFADETIFRLVTGNEPSHLSARCLRLFYVRECCRLH